MQQTALRVFVPDELATRAQAEEQVAAKRELEARGATARRAESASMDAMLRGVGTGADLRRARPARARRRRLVDEPAFRRPPPGRTCLSRAESPDPRATVGGDAGGGDAPRT